VFWDPYTCNASVALYMEGIATSPPEALKNKVLVLRCLHASAKAYGGWCVSWKPACDRCIDRNDCDLCP
jgi:hypothetical protein